MRVLFSLSLLGKSRLKLFPDRMLMLRVTKGVCLWKLLEMR
jgi:hypothetical protein